MGANDNVLYNLFVSVIPYFIYKRINLMNTSDTERTHKRKLRRWF